MGVYYCYNFYMKKINEYIQFLPMSDGPLSADVYVISVDNKTFVYDIGSSDESYVLVNSLDNPIYIISHFHEDHMGNINRLENRIIYLSKYSFDRSKKGIVIDKDTDLSSHVEIVLIPSSHSKGSLGLKVNEYLFVGDALYSGINKGRPSYNQNTLKETIDLINSIDIQFVIMSHDETIFSKNEIIEKLSKIYQKRIKNEPYIYVD